MQIPLVSFNLSRRNSKVRSLSLENLKEFDIRFNFSFILFL